MSPDDKQNDLDLDLQDEIDAAQVDTPIRAALDCAKAKRMVKHHEDAVLDAREDMNAAKERLLAFEYEKLDDPDFKHLDYPVGVLEPGHPAKLLQLRRAVSVAKGRIYSPEASKRIEEYRTTMKAIQDEIDRLPFVADDHEVVSWSVWLLDEKPKDKKGR